MKRIDESLEDIGGVSLGSREATFNARTPEMFKRNSERRGREFDPLLHSTKPKTRINGRTPSDKGVLSFDENNMSDSLESFAHSASFIRTDKDTRQKMAQFQKTKPDTNKLIYNDITSMPLKEQEKVFQEIQQQNWNLKVTILMLEKRLERTVPESQRAIEQDRIRLQTEVKTLELEIIKLRHLLEEKDSRNTSQSDLRQRLEEAIAAADSYKRKNEDLEQKLEDSEYDRRRSEEERDQIDSERDALEEKLRRLEQEADEARERSRGSNDERASVKELRAEMEDLQYQLRVTSQEKEDLESQLDTLQRAPSRNGQDEESPELESLKDKNADLETELWTCKAKLENKNHELEEANLLVEKHGERLQQLQQEKRRLEEDVQTLSSSNLDDQVFELQQDKRALQKELDNRLSHLHTTESERDDAIEKLAHGKKELSAIHEELSNVKLLLNRCNSDVLSLTNEKHDLERQISDLRTHDNRTRLFDQSMTERQASDLERLKEQLRNKEEELDRLDVKSKQDIEYYEQKLASLERLKENTEQQLQNALRDKSRETLQTAIEVEKSNHVEIKRGLEREIESLQSTIKLLRQEGEASKMQIKELQKRSEKMQSEMNDLDDDLVVSHSQMEQIKAQRDSLQGQLSGLQASYESHENTLGALRDINKRETEARMDVQRELEAQELKASSFSKECLQLKELNMQLELKLETLQGKYDKLSQRLSQATESYNETRTRLEAAETERDSILLQTPHKSVLSGLDHSVVDYERRCKQLTREIKALKRDQQVYEYDLQRYKEAAGGLKTKLKEVSADHERLRRKSSEKHDVNAMMTQMRFMRDRIYRESAYRWDLSFMKQFFLMKISSYQACNRVDLKLLQKMDIYPDYSQLESQQRTPRQKFQAGALAVLAAVRIKRRFEKYKEHSAKRNEIGRVRRESRK